MSRSEWLRKQGYDPDMVELEMAADNARADELQLAFDSDPRVRTNGGQLITAPEPKQAPESDDEDV